jgi:hypothetical protein
MSRRDADERSVVMKDAAEKVGESRWERRGEGVVPSLSVVVVVSEVVDVMLPARWRALLGLGLGVVGAWD